jgi:hypothetical protein
VKVCFHFHDHETRFQKKATFTLTGLPGCLTPAVVRLSGVINRLDRNLIRAEIRYWHSALADIGRKKLIKKYRHSEKLAET